MKIKGQRKQLTFIDYQIPFVNDFGRYSALVGGFGSAKTHSLNLKALRIMQQRRADRQKAVIGFYAPSIGDLRNNNVKPMLSFFDELNLKYSYNKTYREMHIPVFNATIQFFHMQDPEQIKGYEITDALIDEFDLLPQHKQEIAWFKIDARVRKIKGGTISIGTTPEGFRETYNQFVVKKVGNLYQIDTRWNPYLPKDYIKSLEGQFDGQLLEQYLRGQFVNIAGLNAYYGFIRSMNMIKEIPTIEDQLNEIWVGMDFNVNPMSAVFGYPAIKNDRKKIVIFDEVEIWNGNTFKMAEYIAQKFPHKRIIVFPDMTGGARKTSAVMTDLQILQKAGFQVRGTKNKYQRDSLNIVNKALIDRDVEIMDNCKKLVNDLEKVVRDEYGNIDKSDAKLTHLSDSFRYIIDRNFKSYATTRKGR